MPQRPSSAATPGSDADHGTGRSVSAPTNRAAEAWTIRRILQWTTSHLAQRGSSSPRLDAEILLAHARGCRRIDLYTHFDEELSEDERSRMRELVRRRAAHEPVAYLVGHREFFSLDFEVDRHVLIPRPDTETLVMAVLDTLRQQPTFRRVLELGTGSGCAAVAVAVQSPGVNLTATDVDPAALAIAQRNARRHNVADRIRFLAGDLFAPLDESARFDVIFSNPPYVATHEFEQLAPDVRDHEPRRALDGGRDGLDVIRRIIAECPRYLVPGGRLLLEIDPAQAEAVQQQMRDTGRFVAVEAVADLAGRTRVIAGAITAAEKVAQCG